MSNDCVMPTTFPRPISQRRSVLVLFVATAVGGGALLHAAAAEPSPLTAPTGLHAAVGLRTVELGWDRVAFASGLHDKAVVVRRDGAVVDKLPATATSYADAGATTGASHVYTVTAHAVRGSHVVDSAPSSPASVRLPGYLVGAATADITPGTVVNLGGFGLGDGSFFPESIADQEVVGRGDQAGPSDSRIRARAIVFGDGKSTVAIADIETQGMFAAYQAGPYGLQDMAEQVAHDIPGLPVEHVVIASDHTHHGPDTIGAWGGVPESYLKLVRAQTVRAIEAAYEQRRYANVRAGASDASDLVYNQGCTEALQQSQSPDYPSELPEVCPIPGKDGMLRAIQATAPGGDVVATLVVFAAHSTTNIGSAIDGDWPQFLGDRMAQEFGGVGIGMEGANGGTQPCRPTCAFTKPSNPGYGMGDRRKAILLNYLAHTRAALDAAKPVTGPVAGARTYIREAIVGPAVTGLFLAGSRTGTPLMRSHENPWMVGQTIRTVVSDLRVGNLLFNGTPGEGFPAIRSGVATAVGEGTATGPRMVIQLGLANDQLGYLIAPVHYVAPIAAEAAVNDNIIFNVSPTIGDHVMCAGIRLAGSVGFTPALTPQCAAYDAVDLPGDVAASVPAGGISLP
jgi:hypothetical protein